MANPFRNPALRRAYDAISQAHARRDSELFWVDGTAVRGSPASNAFWDGFEGVECLKPTREEQATPAYACWRAGRDARSRTGAHA